MYSSIGLILKSSRVLRPLYKSLRLLLIFKVHLMGIFPIIIWLSFQFKAIDDGTSLILECDFEVSFLNGRLLTRQTEGGVDA